MKASQLLALLLDVLKDEPAQQGLVRVWHIEAALARAQAAEAPAPAAAAAPAAQAPDA